MCSAKEFFEKKTPEELSEFLLDTFDRYSSAGDGQRDEQSHITSMTGCITRVFSKHPTNKTLSHELWAIATLQAQFKRSANGDAKMPELLGPDVYNNTAFTTAFHSLRELMAQQPQLIRA